MSDAVISCLIRIHNLFDTFLTFFIIVPTNGILSLLPFVLSKRQVSTWSCPRLAFSFARVHVSLFTVWFFRDFYSKVSLFSFSGCVCFPSCVYTLNSNYNVIYTGRPAGYLI